MDSAIHVEIASTLGKSMNPIIFTQANCPISWGCRIHWQLLCRGLRPSSPNECPGYDIKQYDSEIPVMLELWGIQSVPSLPFLPGPPWPGIIAPDRVLSMGQIELNCTYAELNCLK